MSTRDSDCACSLLLPFSWIYHLGASLRRAMYSAGIARSYRPPVRTISVGNITAGGTGKSPLVELLSARIIAQGKKVAVVRRSRAGLLFGKDLSDEKKLLEENVPGISQFADTNKARAAVRAAHTRPDVILIDDGFQTLSLERDFDIVTVDAAAPFGGGCLLPAGRLREPVRALGRAGAVVLTRCETVTSEEMEGVIGQIQNLTDAPVFPASIEVDCVSTFDDRKEDPSFLQNRKVFAFCGIGNPASFFSTVERLGCEIAGRAVFADHHPYTRADISGIAETAASTGSDLILTTQKDAVKLRDLPAPNIDIRFIRIRLKVTKLERLLELILG